jgi:ABC-type spermidine/putrescine transport system permease subunit II
VLGVAMFVVVSFVLKFIPLGTWARSWAGDLPSVLSGHHSGRILSIGKEYEEAALDLGAPRAVIGSILLPLLYPAILASFAIAFADSLDFVTVRTYPPASSGLLSVKIYNFHRSPTLAVNAAATFLLVTTTVWSSRRWRSSSGTS